MPTTRQQAKEEAQKAKEKRSKAYGLENSRAGLTVYDFLTNKKERDGFNGILLTFDNLDEVVEEKPCFYVLRIPCGEMVKIGKAVDARSRLKSYIVRYNEHLLLVYLKYFTKRTTGKFGHEKVEGEYYNGQFENLVKKFSKQKVPESMFIDPNHNSPEFFEDVALAQVAEAVKEAEKAVGKMPEIEVKNTKRAVQAPVRWHDVDTTNMGLDRSKNKKIE